MHFQTHYELVQWQFQTQTSLPFSGLKFLYTSRSAIKLVTRALLASRMEILPSGKAQFDLHVFRANTFGKQSSEVQPSSAPQDERGSLGDA